MRQRTRCSKNPSFLFKAFLTRNDGPYSFLLLNIYRTFSISFPVFLILCYINEVLDIMKTAERLGMTKGDYAFITLDLNTDVFYKDGQWSGNEGKGSKFPTELNGIIDLSIYRPEIYEEFKMKYETMKNTLDPVIRSKLYHEVTTR